MNGRLAREAGFDGIFVQPASHDAGGALGAAAYVAHQIYQLPRQRPMVTAYLGRDFSDEEICHAIELTKIPAKKVSEVERLAAQLLAQSRIIGWFQGKMEWGPRALGNRSILADPRQEEMKDKINKWVKFREEFRPFAPAVLKEKANQYFEMSADSPFMLFAMPVKPEKQTVIPAVTHVDGSARVQTVSIDQNPRFYKLISSFFELTGVPVILNTSFNVMGEPIVNTPLEAIRCFFSCGMDDLFLGDYWVSKSPINCQHRNEP
jgi:carbamoyltransferase